MDKPKILKLKQQGEFYDYELDRLERAGELQVQPEDLIYSENCHNPKTLYHHEDGTIKGDLGYWVLK